MELRERCKGLIGFKSNETSNFWQELLRILYFIDLIGSTNLIKVSISNFKKLVIKTFKNLIFLLFLQIAHVFTFDRDKKKIKNSQKNRRSPCLYNLTKRDSLSLYSNILAFPPIINRDHQFSHNISSPLQLSACPTILPLSKEKKEEKRKKQSGARLSNFVDIPRFICRKWRHGFTRIVTAIRKCATKGGGV